MRIDSFALVTGQLWFLYKTSISHLTERNRRGQEIECLGESKGLEKLRGEASFGGLVSDKARMNYFSFPKHLVLELSKPAFGISL